MKRVLLLTIVVCLGFLTSSCASEYREQAQNTNQESNEVDNNETPLPAKLPEFPFPPKASTSKKIPNSWIANPGGETNFGDVAKRIGDALEANGYARSGFYSIPGGFVIAADLEKFETSGRVWRGRERFGVRNAKPPVATLEYWLNALRGKVGRYRVVAFMITDTVYDRGSGTDVDIETGIKIGSGGANKLPLGLSQQPFAGGYTCTALVYEFEKKRGTEKAEFVKNSPITADAHLAHILTKLRR